MLSQSWEENAHGGQGKYFFLREVKVLTVFEMEIEEITAICPGRWGRKFESRGTEGAAV